MGAVSGGLGIGAMEYDHHSCNSAINESRGLANIFFACLLDRGIIILIGC
jgi:hypothetical protein